MPEISVIIPAYNAASYLKEAIKSVLQQTFKDLELIVVNDGSIDDTEKIALAFKDVRIKYIFQKNKGQCAASNIGIANATGNFIKFFDADDVMNPKHLETQYEKIKNSKSSVASCKWGRFYNDDFTSAKFVVEDVWRNLDSFEWLKTSLSQQHSMMGGWIWLIPKPLLDKVGWWDETLTLNNDFEFSIRLLLGADKVYFTEEAILYYRTGLASSVSNYNSEKVFNEVYNANLLGCSYLLTKENSNAIRLLCANRFQEWLFAIYPNHKEVSNKFELKIKEWGGSSIKLEGGKLLKLLEKLFGWKMAIKTKIILNKLLNR